MTTELKKEYIGELLSKEPGHETQMMAFLANRRHMGNVIFLDITDSTGTIQAVIDKGKVDPEVFEAAKTTPLESCVFVNGTIDKFHEKPNEIQCKNFQIIGETTLQISPRPRSNIDIYDPALTNQLLTYRHLYLRNPKVMALLKFRSLTMKVIRDWFDANGFLEFDAPILTTTPLYADRSAVPAQIPDYSLFLTQCAGFYLEAGAQAFDKVYNMGPSFRGEESRSKRHLIEYWHVKAEMLSGNREDIINIVETLVSHITKELKAASAEILKPLGTDLCLDGLKTPYPRISYAEAIDQLQALGMKDSRYGEDISTAEAEALSKQFDSPFWIVGVPRSIEPFPYCIDPTDKRLCMVADLIASNGCGEFVGVAEKICDPKMLRERMDEKGKGSDPRYQFVKDVHDAGCAPHIAFGMGFERLIRWLVKAPHVRDTIPFPRCVGRQPTP